MSFIRFMPCDSPSTCKCPICEGKTTEEQIEEQSIEEEVPSKCICPICQSVPENVEDRWRIIAKKLLAQYGQSGMSQKKEIANLCRHIYPALQKTGIQHSPEIHEILSKIFTPEQVQPDDIPDEEKEDVNTSQLIGDANKVLVMAMQGSQEGKCCLTPEMVRKHL